MDLTHIIRSQVHAARGILEEFGQGVAVGRGRAVERKVALEGAHEVNPMKTSHDATLQRLVDMGYLKYVPGPEREAVKQQLLSS